MSERDTYYRTLHDALQKGIDDHTARRLAYIASQKDKPKPTPKRRKK